MAQSCLWIVLFPFMAFLIQVFAGKRLPRQGDWVSVAAIAVSFVLAVPIFGQLLSSGNLLDTLGFTWFGFPVMGGAIPRFDINIGVLVNNLTAIMLFMVTLCATLIHLFSTGYMHGEERYHLFFAYISLFTAGMLGLVVSDNLLTFFMFWEVMGLCSYLLIGFYYKKPSANKASLKAFMTTRVGDTGLFFGLIGCYFVFGTSNFQAIYAGVSDGTAAGATILGFPALAFIGFMVLMGAVGKSAQFPLHVWLPDAMEGPTPVSALIHAATMVAAGVFLLIRMFPVLQAAQVVLPWVAAIGAFTALFAASIALVQTDIKKVLAYSTISQLGYMVMGAGVGAFAAAFLHCITHAFFKACLFLGAGSVIHSVHTNDMRQMGGLRKKMPITFVTMLVSTLAISGVPFFSGFVSKDRILAGALGYGMDHHGILWVIPIMGFAAAGLTAFYMFRLLYLTFFGAARDEHKFQHAHEQPWNMVLPLCVLSTLSLSVWFAGLTGVHAIDAALFEVHWFDKALEMTKSAAGIASHASANAHTAHTLALVFSLILAGGGIFLSSLVYLKEVISAAAWKERLAPFHKVLENKFYFDELYINVFVQKGLLNLNEFLARFDNAVIDRYLVDGWRDVSFAIKSFVGQFDNIVIDKWVVDGTAATTAAGGWMVRRVQTGRVQQYLIFTFAFLVIVLFYV